MQLADFVMATIMDSTSQPAPIAIAQQAIARISAYSTPVAPPSARQNPTKKRLAFLITPAETAVLSPAAYRLYTFSYWPARPKGGFLHL